jgi:hypothetical protein
VGVGVGVGASVGVGVGVGVGMGIAWCMYVLHGVCTGVGVSGYFIYINPPGQICVTVWCWTRDQWDTNVSQT